MPAQTFAVDDRGSAVLRSRPGRHDHGRTLGWRGVIADITEAQRFENQLRLQAEHDALTGLPNRRALLGAVKAALRNQPRAATRRSSRINTMSDALRATSAP